MKRFVLTAAVLATAIATPLAAQNRVDGQSPDAPALAAYGAHAVGVRQFEFVNKDQIDVASITAPGELPRYDRPLTVEMWYPAAQGAVGDTSFKTLLRDGKTEATLHGRAVRDAAAADVNSPLVVLSHGYPGNRFLMAHLAENLASKGYVVAAIDHTDSTYGKQTGLASTLVNRSFDQLFVVDELARLNGDAASGLAGRIDTDNTGVIGFSMGGYGAVVTAGGGVSEAATAFAPPVAVHQQGSPTHEALPDPRVKTAVAIGPWGMKNGLWDAEGLAGIEIPMLFIAGSADTTSGYENGVRAIWEGATSVDRSLLTFDGGGHNTVATIPAPIESYAAGVSGHYTDAVWDTVFMNNVGQHFITAWLDIELKGDAAMKKYLELTPIGSEGPWAGFADGTADGLRFETIEAPAPVPLPASIWLLGAALAGMGAIRRIRA